MAGIVDFTSFYGTVQYCNGKKIGIRSLGWVANLGIQRWSFLGRIGAFMA